MNENEKSDVARSITVSAAPANQPNGIGAIFGMVPQNPSNALPIPMASSLVANLIDEFGDTESINGDCVAVSSNVIQTNLTARDFIYEPNALRLLASIHAPYKSTLNVGTITYNDLGEDGAGFKRSEVVTADVLPFIWGWACRISALDTQRGITKANFAIEDSFVVDVQLKSVFQDGWIVLLNSTQDVNNDVEVTYASDAPNSKTVVTFESNVSEVSNQFTMDVAARKLNISGINVSIDVYPIAVRRETNALVTGLFYADRMEDLAKAFLASYVNLDANEINV